MEEGERAEERLQEGRAGRKQEENQGEIECDQEIEEKER